MLVVPLINVVILITLNTAITLIINDPPAPPSSTPTSNIVPWSDLLCSKKSTCITHNSTCFGTTLSYSETSPEVVVKIFNNTKLNDFKELEHSLQRWENLKKVPKCWQALQPFLCALYLPKCEHDTVFLLSQERCKHTMSVCKILMESDFTNVFPHIDCNNVEQFPRGCKNDVKYDVRSGVEGKCIAPLTATDNTESYYDVVNGCGVKCHDPLVTEDGHQQIHKMIAWCASIALCCNLFVVVTFLIEWRSANKYPALIIFYINLCFAISNLGWLAQFWPKARDDIVCKKDLTLRKSEPSADDNLSCVIVFVVVYYFLMAACVWTVVLTYAWHLSFQAWGKIQERIDKKGAYFHLVAWSLPVILTITTMATRQIDGNSIAGICFVRSTSWSARVGLVLAPIAVTVIIGGYFLSRGLPFLFTLKRDSQKVMKGRARTMIRDWIVRIAIFSLFCMLFVFVTFICHIYEFIHEEEWQKSLRTYVYCLILSSEAEPRDCKLDSYPSVALIQVQLLVMFLGAIFMSSWVWTSSTVDTWRRFLNRVLKKDVQEPIALKKHKIIAQAFAQRKKLTDAGNLEISIQNSHTDPVGFKFEVNSTASHLSSGWIAALHKLVDRRGALVEATTESNSSKRRNSYDSESFTYSVRRVSVESRRHSLDSQISFQIEELTATHKTNTPRPRHHDSRSRGKRRRKDFSRSRRHHKNAARRGSSTSQESQIGMKFFSVRMNNPNIWQPLLKRRAGNAGLDTNDPLNGKLPISIAPVSDDEPSQGNSNSNISDDDLCPPGQGIQTLESDSDGNSHRQYSDDEEETTGIESILQLEKAISARGSHRKHIQISDLEYHKKDKYKSDEYYSKSSRRSRAGESAIVKRQKILDEDVDNLLRKSSRHQVKISQSGGDIKYTVGKPRNRKSVGIECKNLEDSKPSDSESEFDESSRLMQQTSGSRIRAGSSRSKRSVTVDVGTQVSTQEMATQTDPDPNDYNGHAATRSSTSNQGTQMTPPFHIRLINKTLSGNGNSMQLRENNYSFSSVTDQGSEAHVK